MRGIGLILYITISYKYRLIPNIFLFIPGLCYILLYVIHCSRETRHCTCYLDLQQIHSYIIISQEILSKKLKKKRENFSRFVNSYRGWLRQGGCKQMCADALEEYERLVSESPKLLYSLRCSVVHNGYLGGQKCFSRVFDQNTFLSVSHINLQVGGNYERISYDKAS